MAWWNIGVTLIVAGITTDITVRSANAAAKRTEQAALLNAKEKQIQAKQAMEVAAENARRKQKENRRHLAQVRAATAASGLEMTGSPLAVFGETALDLEQQILDISFDAENRRRALIAGAEMDIWEGESQSAAIRNQATAEAIGNATSSAAGAASSSGYLSGSGSRGSYRPSGSPGGF